MSEPRRPRSGREPPQAAGVIINNSTNFTVGALNPPSDDGEEPPHEPPRKAQRYRLRTFTGRVLEGRLVLPGQIAGDLLLGLALVLRDDETSIVTASLEGNAVIFDDDDLETVAGAHATVSYLTAI